MTTNNNKQDWDSWLELELAELEQAKNRQKTYQELDSEAYQAYCQAQYKQAAELYHQAGELARKENDISAWCEELYWEGHGYQRDNQLTKALRCFLKAEKLGGLDSVNQFKNLARLVDVALVIPSPYRNITEMLSSLIPYKGGQAIGGSKSWVLVVEGSAFFYRGENDKWLAKAQEAFASQVDTAPMYNDSVYYRDLVSAYRVNKQYSEAWKWLRRWREKGSTAFADTKIRQLFEEGRLLYDEGRYIESWDTFQRCMAEEKYLGRAGASSVRLLWYIKAGGQLRHHDALREQIWQIFRHRGSQCGHDRYYCRKGIALYYCTLLERLNEEEKRPVTLRERFSRRFGSKEQPRWDRDVVRKRAEKWLNRAEKCARELDELLECSRRTKEICQLREGIRGM